ncbi:MAG: hypothetical protein ACE5JX_13395 [Acidobacteriota bacterium]
MLQKGILPALLGIVLAPSVQAEEPGLREILDRHYEAIGGLERITSVHSRKMTGKMVMAQGMETAITLLAKRPHKVRIEFTLHGLTGVRAFDGSSAWMVMPFMGKTEPEKVPPEETEGLKEQADMDGPLVNWKAKGNQVELIGKAKVGDSDTYKLKVTFPGGSTQYYHLNSGTYLLVKVSGSREILGQELGFETTLADYRAVRGLMLPHLLQSKTLGAGPGQTITIDKIEINPDVDDAQFVMPKVEKKGSEKPQL